jgi:hypothetical protein
LVYRKDSFRIAGILACRAEWRGRLLEASHAAGIDDDAGALMTEIAGNNLRIRARQCVGVGMADPGCMISTSTTRPRAVELHGLIDRG